MMTTGVLQRPGDVAKLVHTEISWSSTPVLGAYLKQLNPARLPVRPQQPTSPYGSYPAVPKGTL